MTHLKLNKLIKFQNDHIFQHNGFINIDKKYLGTFLSKKKMTATGLESTIT